MEEDAHAQALHSSGIPAEGALSQSFSINSTTPLGSSVAVNPKKRLISQFSESCDDVNASAQTQMSEPDCFAVTYKAGTNATEMMDCVDSSSTCQKPNESASSSTLHATPVCVIVI